MARLHRFAQRHKARSLESVDAHRPRQLSRMHTAIENAAAVRSDGADAVYLPIVTSP